MSYHEVMKLGDLSVSPETLSLGLTVTPPPKSSREMSLNHSTAL